MRGGPKQHVCQEPLDVSLEYEEFREKIHSISPFP
jgi:hypothetical protein